MIKGTAIFLIKDGHFIAGKRENTSHFEGYYGLPGGKIEKDESFDNCIIRETYEETGVVLNDVKTLGDPVYYNLIKDAGSEIICKYYYAFIEELPLNNPENKKWEWFSIDKPPEKMMPGTYNIIKERLINELRI